MNAMIRQMAVEDPLDNTTMQRLAEEPGCLPELADALRARVCGREFVSDFFAYKALYVLSHFPSAYVRELLFSLSACEIRDADFRYRLDRAIAATEQESTHVLSNDL